MGRELLLPNFGQDVSFLPLAAQKMLYVWPAMESLATSTARGCFAIGIKGTKLDPL